ncbi:MAG: hypothetical protein PHS62_00095 [Patescibacteria group bacterium]|nr:hypothetical protein [Patescibacteria group bacterium]
MIAITEAELELMFGPRPIESQPFVVADVEKLRQEVAELDAEYRDLATELSQYQEVIQWREEHQEFVRKFERMIRARALVERLRRLLQPLPLMSQLFIMVNESVVLKEVAELDVEYRDLAAELSQDQEAIQWRRNHRQFVRAFEKMVTARAVADRLRKLLYDGDARSALDDEAS